MSKRWHICTRSSLGFPQEKERKKHVKIQESIALVTGANRGLGQAFVQALLDKGAQKIYVGARTPSPLTDPRLQSLKLDITDPHDVADAAHRCQDVTILINNAGIMHASPLLGAPSMEQARGEMETNYFGTLAMCRAFAPILGNNGGGALVNMLSVVSWFTNPLNGSYCASKAAEWSLTNGVRIELRAQGTLVIGVHAGFIDTQMVADLAVPKVSPQTVAARTMEAIAQGHEEVLADARTQRVKAALATDPEAFYQQIQENWDKAQWQG
jgi:NAD(P)-dependent dehydrogenase (short-subunit alcohol dehydrogenase family)